MTKDEALKLALEALEPFSTPHWAGAGVDKANEAITAIKQALAAPVQEPAVWVRADGMKAMVADEKAAWIESGQPDLVEDYNVPAYTTPPAAQRQWVGLTDEEMQQSCYEAFSYDPYVIARAIEAKLKEKNT